MPELPEVEVVRRGVERWAVDRPIAGVEVLGERSVRRHLPGARDFADRQVGHAFARACRRGKYLWLELDGEDWVLMVHLGMSGQLLLAESETPDPNHLHIRWTFADSGPELRFVDQRTFGGSWIAGFAEPGVPEPVAHIGRDPLDEAFDLGALTRRLRARRTGIKRALLDQTLMSGVGNIYADEALWRVRMHPETPTDSLRPGRVRELVAAVTDVMSEALAAGGTSFDSLYVNVNGQSGYFSRDLQVYGREGEPCRRCGRPIVREPFMNRSSYRCRWCQRSPRGFRT